MPVQISISQSVSAPKTETFQAAVGIDARELIRKHGPLPAIINVDGHDAPWSEIGQTRIHTLSDRSSVREELVGYTADQTFAYHLTNFSGALAPLVSDAKAEWHFTTTGENSTQIDWTYIFNPRGPIAEPVVWFLVKLFWPGYLKSALIRVKEKAEGPSL